MRSRLTWNEGIRSLVYWGDVYFAANHCRKAEFCWQKALNSLGEGPSRGENAAALKIKLAGLYQWTGNLAQWRRYLSDAIEGLALAKGKGSPVVRELKKYLSGRKPLFKAVALSAFFT